MTHAIGAAPRNADPRERRQFGRERRKAVPRSSFGDWHPPTDRTGPVATLTEQATPRLPALVPLRHGRMLASPFAFYRGGAAIMAADLSESAVTGLRAQLCGDAHLSNFGGFAAPDRTLVFDVNDFDETLPGPWEWDVARLAASFEIAARGRGFGRKARRRLVSAAALEYRRSMRRLAELPNLALWYLRADADSVVARFGARLDARGEKLFERNVVKARAKDAHRALATLTERVDGQLRIVSRPPLVVPIEEVDGELGARAAQEVVEELLESYRDSLPAPSRHLFDGYRYVHGGRKVVGVGSVGTRCWIALFVGRDEGDPLFLQIKEAMPSVLEPFAGRCRTRHDGRRVVEGQRLTQAASDPLLGWMTATSLDGRSRHFYVRQLWDQKLSARLDLMTPAHMRIYAELCGATLARAHARTGDRIAIAGYLGKGATFDDAMVRFAAAYADRNETDLEECREAAARGELEVESEPG